ncbi:gliding motility-associated C-terminal domain-containing protein [Flavobacterium sp. PL02]|uniref:Ig-like domain-containing protein n=1 Tax=Flavobacterium sp. PL02 TaxID=3088354 RepID=UPI002B238BB7|nr:gliding motility-associated C-terminal domain-containing protein [Flavobacterium sp. PL02]MEA9412536.1 gliding motility-associated C-terminal domain-containing protein [Flavobacterium sp. PL02]
MKNIKLLILLLVFLPLVGGAQVLDFTTVSTPAFCVNDGSITVTATNAVGRVQYELVDYKVTRSVIGTPQDDPVFLNLAPGTYTVGVYDDNNASTPITKEVIVPDYGSGRTLTINNIYSNRLAYCATDTNPGARLTVVPNGGAVPYTITILDTNDVIVREETSYSSYNFQGMPAGTYKIRVKDNCGTIVNSNSPYVIAPNIVYNFTVTTPTYWYWDNNVKVAHGGAGTICDPVTDAYYDFSYSGGIPVITGNDVFPISQVPGMTRMYAVEYDGVKTPYMTYNELIAYKQPLPLDINAWKSMTLWVSICGIEKSTIYNLPSRKNEFLPKLIANAGLTFYLADDKASTLCTPTGLVTLSRLSLLSGFCDPLTLTITEKNGVVPPKQYTITAANQNDFEAQLAIGNTYTFKLTDINGSELNRLSFVNVTRGQWINMNSRTEVFIDPANFRYYNQDELPLELASMADFKNFGKSQLGIKLDYYMPMPYTIAVTGPNGFYLEKTVNTMSYSGTLISDNLEVGNYSVHITSATGCYDRTFTTTLDRAIDSISVTSTITPDPVSCDRYIKTFNYKISNQGLLRPYPSTSFESMFNVPQIGFKVIDGPAGYTETNAIVNSSYSWPMSFRETVTAAFRGDITGLYKINLVDYYTPTNVYGGPWELDVKSEFPVFDMNGSGGTICTGSTTGTLSVVVKNATSPMYYLKKTTDTDYPVVGQSSSDFPNLTAGVYMVKVETACYPTALEASFKMDYVSNLGHVITGTNVLCDTDTLNLSVKSIGPITSAEWRLPDGTTQTSNTLVLDNPQSGEYTVNIITRSGCIVTDTVEVKINRRATAADITGASNSTICEGTGVDMLLFSSITNPIFTWYSDVALTDVIATGENYGAMPTVTTSYYVTVQGDDICENLPGTAKEIVITVKPRPAIPTGDAVQKFCTATTVGNIVTNETGVVWYTAATGGIAIPNNTSLINGRTYYGELQSGICASLSRLAVTVTINRLAVAADISILDQTICPGIGITLPPYTTISNPIFTWYDDEALTNPIGTSPIWLEPLVTTTYYITVKGDGVCENLAGTAKPFTIIVNPHPDTPIGDANQSFCEAATVADLVVSGINVEWYDSPEFGRFVTPNTPLVNGTTYYAASHVYPLCESEIRLAVTATIYPALVVTLPVPQISGNQCIFPDINFDSNNPGTLYVWSVDNWSIGLEDNWISSPNIPSFKAINSGTKPVTATVTVHPIGTVCGTGSFTFTITVNPDIILTKPTDKEVCTNNIVSEIVFDSNITGTTYGWTNDNPRIGLAAVGTGNIPAFTAINTSDSTEIATITVMPTAAGCTSIPVVFTIKVNPEGVIDKIENQKICVGETAVLTASSSTVINPVFTWYRDAALTDVLGVGVSFTTPVLTSNKIYYVTVKGDNACEANAGMTVMVTVNETLPPTGDVTQEFCLAFNATVSDLVTNENNVIWYDAPIAGNIIPTGTELVNGTIYYGSLTVGTCESATRLAVTAIINDARTPTGDANQEFCLNEKATVGDLVTNESNVIWYDAPIAGNIISTKRALNHGAIYYGSLRVGACENVVRLAVTAIIKTDLPGETIGWNTTACIGDEVTYKTTVAMSDYNWIVTGGVIKAGGQLNDDFVTVTWTAAGNGSIEVEFINVFNCNPIVTIHFPVTIAVCSDIAIGKVVNNPTSTIGENVIFTITTTNIGTGDFKNVSIDEMLPSGYSYVMATTTSGNYNSVNGVWNLPVLAAGTTETLTLTAKVLETGDYLNVAYLKDSTPTDPNPDNNRAEAAVVPTGIVIYNAVSANGDGLNDYFKIEGLQHYPDNTVEIYNRWGVKIYEANGYGLNNNVFRGISEGRSTVKNGDIVPAGTYFYILRYKTNTESRIEKSGYLYIN